MPLYYKNKNGDNKFRELPSTESTEIRVERDLNSERRMSIALDFFCDTIPKRLLHLAVWHKSPRVRNKNQKRIWKIWIRLLKEAKRI